MHNAEQIRGRVERQALEILVLHLQQEEEVNHRVDAQAEEPGERRAYERVSTQPMRLVRVGHEDADEACPRERQHVHNDERVERVVEYAEEHARRLAKRPVAEHREHVVVRIVAHRAHQIHHRLAHDDLIEDVVAFVAICGYRVDERAVDDQAEQDESVHEDGRGQTRNEKVNVAAEECVIVERRPVRREVVGRLGRVETYRARVHCFVRYVHFHVFVVICVLLLFFVLFFLFYISFCCCCATQIFFILFKKKANKMKPNLQHMRIINHAV